MEWLKDTDRTGSGYLLSKRSIVFFLKKIQIYVSLRVRKMIKTSYYHFQSVENSEVIYLNTISLFSDLVYVCLSNCNFQYLQIKRKFCDCLR